ncbi:MAG: endopeptidase La [Firmicutes bacterium]|nr:endopeptidase La [Bacillota bacterium]
MKIPMIPLRGVVVFPNMVTSISVGRKKSLDSLEKAMASNELVYFVAQRNPDVQSPKARDLCSMGTVARVKQVLKLPGNLTHVIVEGLYRGLLIDTPEQEDAYYANIVEVAQDLPLPITEKTEALMRLSLDYYERYMKMAPKFTGAETVVNVLSAEKPGQMADIMATTMSIRQEEKQIILELSDPVERLKAVVEILHSEINVLSIKQEIDEKVKKKIDKSQREYYLKEQMKVIREELGEDEDPADEAEELREKLKKAKLSPESREHILREIDRLEKLSSSSPEANVIRTYVEYVLSLPWNKKTKENNDITRAEAVLEADHYGLEKVKERIIEFLAVKQNVELKNAPIICLLGPPGVGKTSVAKSVARAVNRKYVRMSLGGVKDEAEIRGHRRTYVGAMAGRIIDAIKRAGSSNPLILLDEVDKLSSSYSGDPASALLEVLDSEQNVAFRDHYLEIPYDLSDVLFICTANGADTIPAPLLDRMELIELSSYTADEKMNIAKKHLYPKQLKKHGLNKNKLKINEAAFDEIISGYTKEAGVRKLERLIERICRKAVKTIVEGERKSISVTPKNLEEYLGKPKYRHEKIYKDPQKGIVRGLAWTRAGGETLSIEVNTMKGAGKFVLTGNMGDVMKESAKAAISYIRSQADDLKLDKDFYKETDIHIHIPEGAVPKDGPSAGITMATAMLSALTGAYVRNDVAMTGEITIRGRVLPIGGLKEKIIAAKRAGITKVIVPYENRSDLEEIPESIKENIEFVLAREMSDVLDNALADGESVWR